MTPANCPRCGGRLARDNDSGRCGPCQAAERDRLVAPPTVPATFWQHEPVRQALVQRHLGRVIRAYRNHPYHGRFPLPQTAVAAWLGITQAQLSRVENGSPLVHLDRLTHWAQLLRIPAEHLWFALPVGHQPTDRRAPASQTNDGLTGAPGVAELDRTPVPADTVKTASDEGGGTTDRRRFNVLAALAGIGATGYLDLFARPDDGRRSVDMEQVRFASSLVEEFRQADAAIGADELCEVAVQIHACVTSWAAKAAYSREVGSALQTALADLANQAAWLLIDAERKSEARPFLDQAITRARIVDDPQEEVRAFACLSLLTREDRPGESLQCADAALRTSAGWATPRLRTLLHLRAAHAYANLKDSGAFNREMAKARREFEHGTHEDDQPFLCFVTDQEVTGIQGMSYLTLGRPDRAVESFRTITANPSPTHRRNQVYYRIRLAEAAHQQGDFNEAARLALEALPEVTKLKSRRTKRLLAAVRSHLGQLQTTTATRQNFIDAYDEATRR